MSADKEAKKICDTINKFRNDPTFLVPYIQNLKNGIARLDPKNEMLKKYDGIIRCLGVLDKVPPLRLSEELCESAKAYLEKCLKKKPEKSILRGEKECKGIVPENFLENEDSMTMVGFYDGYEAPEFQAVRLIYDTEDPETTGRSFITSPEITQVGIAVSEPDQEEASCVIIFDDDEYVLDDKNFKLDPEFDDAELRRAFEALDYQHKNKVNVIKVCDTIKNMGKDKTDPELAQMFEELKKKNYVEISYPEFAQFFHTGMLDNESEKGRKRIFNIFKPTAEFDSIDYSQLKSINEFVHAGFTEQQIRTMLKMNNHNKYGISYDDYVDRLEFKKEHPEDESA